jgi:glutamine synthetase
MGQTINVPELFGSGVFSDAVMKRRLPKETYKAFKKTIASGEDLSIETASVVASGMKAWATELGATHFTHWFQPMTGVTAEKHDSFISPIGDGTVLMEFSGRELVKGEPDASSFPSGGIRATFEARGYTAWDPTSPAFVKDGTLYIPTAFCSYTGETLDKKTPLLRSMDALSKQAARVLRLFGKNAENVSTTVGPEQEYFIIDKETFRSRPDLLYTGRTLFGARPPKGQEMEDQYYGQINPRIVSFMHDLDEACWKLGILAKTKHNEVAPAQHEMAPIFSTTNVATDHNQLLMELIKKIADKHGLAGLLHEKPFAGVNGSGKHNNWSMSTDSGENLLDPGDTPWTNFQFLTFLSAIVKAVDQYQGLLRLSVSSPGNDHRLGANEAPPAIVSIFLGDTLSAIVDAMVAKAPYTDPDPQSMALGASVLPTISKDNTDRNRTSPFAFTGNKFEFRMLGSSVNISDANFILNTIVADALSDIADKLETSENFEKDVKKLIAGIFRDHGRIIFNGDNYSEEWVSDAERRGLLNLKSTVEAAGVLIEDKAKELFARHHVLTEREIESRYEIILENYSKTINIEALTLADMIKKGVIPAVVAYSGELADVAVKKKAAGVSAELEGAILSRLSSLGAVLYKNLNAFETVLIGAKDADGALAAAKYYREKVFADMAGLRGVIDELETIVAKKHWPYPTYAEILNSVK